MNFSAWSIRTPIPSLLLFGLLSAAGVIGFRMLPVQDIPDLDLPTVTVTAVLPGATPSALETEVTRRIEDAMATIQGIRHMASTISAGASVTRIEFDLEKDPQEAVGEVRNAVDRILASLPPEMEIPAVSRVAVAQGAIVTFAVASGTLDETELSWFVDNEIGKRMLSVKGVGEIVRVGGLSREVRVEVDRNKLVALNTTMAEVSDALRRTQQEAPGGLSEVGGLEQSIRTLGSVRDAAGIASLQLPLADGRNLRLDTIASVRDAAAERRQLALLDGKPVIAFEVRRARGASEVLVAGLVRDKAREIAAAFPSVDIREVSSTILPIVRNYESAMRSLWEGALLAVAVVWFFLRDARATLVSAVALPLSLVPTFAAMALLGFQLNTITLLALTLVVGVLVDDAIVEVENIERHLAGGKKPREAALEGADEIGLAVIATSLTLVAVFLPTAAMKGVVGLFFRQFGWSASIAVLFSLLVARLLTPMMAAHLLKPRRRPEREEGRLMAWYLKTARLCLMHPARTLAGVGAFMVATAWAGTALSTTFLVAEDVDQIGIDLELPPASRIDETRALAERVRSVAVRQPEVRGVYASVGAGSEGGFGDSDGAGETRKASLTLLLSPAAERKRSQQELEDVLRDDLREIPGARLAVGGGGMGQKVSVVLAGDDTASLHATANRVLSELRTLRDVGNITSSASLQRPEVIVRPDFPRAAQLGVTASDIGEAVRVATTGDYDENLPRLNLAARQVYVRAQLAPEERGRLSTLENLPVRGKDGSVPLGRIASLSIEGGPAQINRYDRSRNVTIDVETQNRPIGDVLKEIDALPSLRNLPPDVRRIESGEAENLDELFVSFGLAMLIGVLCVYAVLVLLFHDFMQPATILAALPLSLGGAFGALALFRLSLSVSSLIGLVMLMGIVTKNSILLVEYALLARKRFGLGRTEAVLDACRKRARPIIMTTAAMIAGMLPMAVGDKSAFQAPMAVAVIGGLLTSTGLSLLAVPVLFELVDDLKAWALSRLRSISGHSTPSE